MNFRGQKSKLHSMGGSVIVEAGCFNDDATRQTTQAVHEKNPPYFCDVAVSVQSQYRTIDISV